MAHLFAPLDMSRLYFACARIIDWLVYSEVVAYLRGTKRVRLARISRLLDEWSAYQLFVVRDAVGLEDVRRVLQGRVLHLMGFRPAGLSRR